MVKIVTILNGPAFSKEHLDGKIYLKGLLIFMMV